MKNFLNTTVGNVIKYVILLWLISIYVFWECGHTYNVPKIWYKVTHPHTIDLMDDILSHYFPALMSLSVWLNVLSSTYLVSFFQWVSSGKIRIVGGNGGNQGGA